MFISGLLIASIFTIIQASGLRAKEINSFELDQEAYRFTVEKRTKLLENCNGNEDSDGMDQQISEAVRLRLTQRILEANRKHRMANGEKAKSQRWVALAILVSALGAFGAITLPVEENLQGRSKPAIVNDGEKVR